MYCTSKPVEAMKQDTEITFQVFDYIGEIDAFVINKSFEEVARVLGTYEWHAAVWIGRYFTLDSDYGEHWFDNWDLRDEREAKAAALGIAYDDLMVIDPTRFKMKDFGGDGPCHSDEQIKRFWTDVLKSLKVSLALMIEEARKNKREWEAIGAGEADEKEYIADLEARITQIRHKHAGA